ncbi:MAG: hypothetical protein WAN74_05005 [Thermoplasmata archaeon]
MDIYEVAPGGGKSEDPSVAYDTLSYEPILNVYQTLVAYNGSSTTNFVPELATCVPGSAQCTTLYGSSLITNNPTTSLPQYFTFVLDSSAQFYDPSTGARWGVYPSDVMFTLSRTMSFSELPGVGTQNGWIQTQALVPFGNYAYDGGIHYPYNNTPGNVLSSMLVNDSTYCPAAAMAQNGCITFDAAGSGTDWPFFLELVADPLGSGIEPCGWFTYVGAGVPGFAGTTAVNGDGPCLLPGGATSTNSTAFQNYVATVDPTSWDSLQLLAASSPLNPQPAVKESMVGSGPYYLETIDNAIGYVLKANPAYEAPTGCASQPGCQPLPGDYQGTVNVFWEETDQQGIANYRAGQADLGGIQLPAHVSTLQGLVANGTIDLTYIPTLSIFFMPYNLNFNVSLANFWPGGTTNVPGDFFSQIGLRQFITNAYPYASINSSLLQAGNISTGFGYGGAIPKYLGDYYAYNITWPQSNPSTNPNATGGAAWWWSQANNASSPYYDAELAACTAVNPCTFAIIGTLGSTFITSAIPLLIAEIESLTGDRLQPYLATLGFGYCGYPCSPGPGGDTLWNLGWAPDYPDPSDYTAPMYQPTETVSSAFSYTVADSVPQELSLPQFNSPSCAFASNYSNPTDAWAALVHYHGLPELPDACQGVAFNITSYWYQLAATLSIGPQRTLDYQMANQLDYLLALYIWNFQDQIPETYAPWINGATLNANPMIGGGGDNPWYTLGYSSSTNTVTFTESGMPPAAGGGVAFNGGGLTPFGAGGTLRFGGLVNGSYNYTISAATGYYRLVSSNPSSPVTVSGSGVTVSVVFEAIYTVTVTELGMPPTAGGGVEFNGSGLTPFARNVDGIGTVTFSNLTNGSYSYTIGAGTGYQVVSSTPNSPVVVNGIDATVLVEFEAVFSVTFTQTGIPNGTIWTVEVTRTSTTPLAAASGGISWVATSIAPTTPDYLAPANMSWSANSTGPTALFQLPNGTYSYVITASGYPTTTGTFAVNGQAQPVPVTVSSNSSGLAWWVCALIGVVIAAIVIGAVIAVMRRSRPPKGSPSPPSLTPPS